jgi:Tfp pilus assembly protein PilF
VLFLSILLAGSCFGVAAQGNPLVRDTSQRLIAHWNNLGVAYMNQQKPEEALQAFNKAHALDPKAYLPELNRGIALLNQQKADEARPILEALTERNSKDARVWFNLGLLFRNTGQRNEALQAFSKAAEFAPDDAEAQYFIGDIYNQSQQYDRAIQAFQRALALNSFAVSAEFGIARAYQREGNTEEARKHLARFQQITRDKLGAPISPIYGEQGPLSLVQRIEGEPVVPAPIPVKFTVVTSSGLPEHLSNQTNHRASMGSGVCIFDYDGDGAPDIFLANAGHAPALYRNLGGGRFEDVTRAAGFAFKNAAIGCAAGDVDNDGKPDLAISFAEGVLLFHNDGGKFRDITDNAGFKTGGDPFSLLFVDYDHDGDLDLYITSLSTGGAQSSHNRLWRNNGNGTFTEIAESVALTGTGPTLSAIASDINNDRAIDLVTTSLHNAPTLYANPREGVYPASQPWPAASSAAAGVSVLDFNKDGWMDVAFTHQESPGISLWGSSKGKQFEQVPLPNTNWKRAWGIAAFDYDNDGWIDLAAIGETGTATEIRLFRNRGPQGFEDVTAAVGLDKVKLQDARALVAFDFDENGATDLLITQADGSAVLLRNNGAERNHSVRIALKGLADNKSAFGTKVEVFAGEQRQKFEIAGSSGYLSQAPAEINAGIGSETNADVRILWPTGVIQDELELAANKRSELLETDRRGSSCPVLFAWNGSRYELVSDVIGPAVIGHWVAPGETDVADPDEYVKVDGSRMKLRDGYLSFRFAEPMEEVNYLDQARLVAVDHPKTTAVYPNERFVSNPPFPAFKVISSEQAHLPIAARDGDGHDVLPALRERDHKYVTGFPLLKFAGFAQMHTLELDLGDWDASKPLRLLMHGFTEYFTANSMYAAYQANIQVVAPYLEALDSSGQWKRVIDDLGFPAGLPRTMVADLSGHIPAGTRRIRIVTNLQIYWDQILIDNGADDTSVRVHEVPLANAGLHFHGYPRSEEKYFPGDLNYIYEDVSATGPYARHVGSYTHYGDVLPLLQSADDHYVIFGSGEEVTLDFDPKALPPLPDNWERDYFFYANGFVKDMDFYETDFTTVQTLPFHGMKGYPYPKTEHYPDDAKSVGYQLEYNDRYQSGDGIPSFRYAYPEDKKP